MNISFWCLYGLITGLILMIALYLFVTPHPSFSSANIVTSRTIRKSAAMVIAVSALEYIAIIPIIYWLHQGVPGVDFFSVSEWGSCLAQQMKVLFFLPAVSVFLLAVMQGMSKIKVSHILLCTIFPAFLLIWTIVYGLKHIPEEGMLFCKGMLTLARVYWGLYIVLLLYLYSKSLHRYRVRIKQIYSSIGYRGVRWLYWLLGMNVVYFAWFAITHMTSMPLATGVMIQHVMSLLISIFTCYQADHQELIVWEKEEPESTSWDVDYPAVAELDGKLAKLVEQQVYLNADLMRDDLVEMLSTNRTYLNMYFSAKNQSFYSFVNGHRIAYAIKLMHTSYENGTPMSLKEVALSSGFKSMEVFSRYFKNIKGCSASQYLEQNILKKK